MRRITTLHIASNSDVDRFQVSIEKRDGKYELRSLDSKMNEDIFIPLTVDDLIELRTMLNTFI